VSGKRSREIQKGVAEALNLPAICEHHPFENRMLQLKLQEEMFCVCAEPMGMQAKGPLFFFGGNVDLYLFHGPEKGLTWQDVRSVRQRMGDSTMFYIDETVDVLLCNGLSCTFNLPLSNNGRLRRVP
jgi:hypothetical protein